MQQENLTDRFLDRIHSLKYSDIPNSALAMLRTCLADTLGVTLAGAADLKEKEERLLNILEDNSEVVAPIGFSRKTSIPNAILLNGLSSHFLELDDGVRYGVIHPSAPLFSALIPVAIVKNASWQQFVLGAIYGYETSIRIASAMQPSHYSKGYHPTATCCTLGVAVGIGVMLHYTRGEIMNSFGAATISSCGTLKVLEDVSELKPYNCAKAALMGYYAAMMGKAGFTSPEDPLKGDSGFMKMMCDSYDEERLIGKWDTLAIEKVYLKPYASCRHTHPEIEAAFAIRNLEGFDAEKISSIKISTYKGVLGKHDFNTVYGESSARMSIPYSLAVALVTGRAGIEEFTEKYIQDPLVQKLTKMAVIEGDEELSKLVPDKRVAIVYVEQTDGRSFLKRVDYPKGEPENKLSDDELYAKFSSMSMYAGLTEEKAKELFHTVMEGKIIDYFRL